MAPGTAGSLVAALLYLWIGRYGWTLQVLVILVALAAGLWAGTEMEGSSGIHDDRRIVIDEVVGQWIALCSFHPTPVVVISGFLLFRLLDIFKPFPANWIDQRWSGSRGVMFDDVVSGIYAQLLLRAGFRIAGLF